MYILGISCFYHDSAAALLADGELIAAAQEERFSRQKNDYRFPSQAVAFCLRRAGIFGEGGYGPGDLGKQGQNHDQIDKEFGESSVLHLALFQAWYGLLLDAHPL